MQSTDLNKKLRFVFTIFLIGIPIIFMISDISSYEEKQIKVIFKDVNLDLKKISKNKRELNFLGDGVDVTIFVVKNNEPITKAKKEDLVHKKEVESVLNYLYNSNRLDNSFKNKDGYLLDFKYKKYDDGLEKFGNWYALYVIENNIIFLDFDS